MPKKVRRKKPKPASPFESIDRIVSADADIYGVNRSLETWTVRPVIEETVAFVMRLNVLLDLNLSQRDALVHAVVDALYPNAERPSGDYSGLGETLFTTPSRGGFRINEYEGIPIVTDRPTKRQRKRIRKVRTEKAPAKRSWQKRRADNLRRRRRGRR